MCEENGQCSAALAEVHQAKQRLREAYDHLMSEHNAAIMQIQKLEHEVERLRQSLIMAAYHA